MSCFHPNGVLYSGGLPSRFVGSLSTSRVESFESNGWDVVPVPCGHCLGCRLDRSKYWAERMLLEYATHRDGIPDKSALFVTLTYDDDHVPFVRCHDGVMRHNLDPRDPQLFIKRLRKFYDTRFDRKLRFYLCGEYGSTTFRPHYHMILFGATIADFPDAFVYSTDTHSKQGDGVLYESLTLDSIWSFGAVRFSVANFQTFAYVGRYVLKKQYGSDSTLSLRGRIPPFCRMSLKPGLGSDYFKSFDGTKVFLSDGNEVHQIGIPRCVLDKLQLTDPDLYATIKEQRRFIASGYQSLIQSALDGDYFDYLKQQERTLQEKTRSLKRV